MQTSISDQNIDNQFFTDKKLPAREYDNCTFIKCDFSKADMSVVTFLECRFEYCNFGPTMMKETSFQEVFFLECKMLGVDFSACNDFMFSVTFDSCNLDFVSFFSFKLKNTVFTNCSLKETDFTETELTGSVFDTCDLFKAVFENSILEKVDFRTAKNFTINPESNRMKKAKFSKSGLLGLLAQYDLEIQ